MTQLFRNIRRRLLHENRFTRYLIYAIGEIFLIVIGILIALKLNNLNEARKNTELEQVYLHGILDNLAEDIIALEGHADLQRKRLNYFTILLKAFSDDNLRSEYYLLKKAISDASTNYDFDPQRNIFDGMRSSGKVEIIQSPELLHKIQEYYKQSEAVVKWENESNDNLRHHKREVYSNFINYNSTEDFDSKWESKLDEEDFMQFFKRKIDDDKVKVFANRVTDMKVDVYWMMGRELGLREMAIELQNTIREYLGEEIIPGSMEDEAYLAEFYSEFIPSPLEHKVAISKEELLGYIGSYQKVQDSTAAERHGEKATITLDKNHLMLTLRYPSIYCYYYLGEETFQRELAFLFNDSDLQGILTFKRGGKDQVIEFVRSDWLGTSTYRMVADNQSK